MSNADMPAMPQSLTCDPAGSIYSGFDKSQADCGLTKREYFAAHAPTTPDWFEFDSNEQKPPAPEQPGPAYGVSVRSLPVWAEHERKMRAYEYACKAHGLRWEMARIVAWRYAYADAMLAEVK
jgi:hypothetical protein